MVTKKPGSGCCLITVSCSIGFEQRRKELEISKSAAYSRGLKFFFDEQDYKETSDTLQDKCARLARLNQRLIEENKLLKRMTEVKNGKCTRTRNI